MTSGGCSAGDSRGAERPASIEARARLVSRGRLRSTPLLLLLLPALARSAPVLGPRKLQSPGTTPAGFDPDKDPQCGGQCIDGFPCSSFVEKGMACDTVREVLGKVCPGACDLCCVESPPPKPPPPPPPPPSPSPKPPSPPSPPTMPPSTVNQVTTVVTDFVDTVNSTAVGLYKEYGPGIIKWVKEHIAQTVFLSIFSCCVLCCLPMCVLRACREREERKKKQQTQYKAKQIIKEKTSKDKQNGGTNGSAPNRRASAVAMRRASQTGKRRSMTSSSATDAKMDMQEIEEEEQARLLTEGDLEGVGLQAKPMTSSIYKSKTTGLTTVRVVMGVPFKRKDVFRELVNRKCPIDIDEERM